jgi:hypothetical protein
MTSIAVEWNAVWSHVGIQLTIAFLLATILWSRFARARTRLGRRGAAIRVTPDALYIDQLNHILGANTHDAAHFAVPESNDCDDLRLDLADVASRLTAEILETLTHAPGASSTFMDPSRLERAMVLLERYFEQKSPQLN